MQAAVMQARRVAVVVAVVVVQALKGVLLWQILLHQQVQSLPDRSQHKHCMYTRTCVCMRMHVCVHAYKSMPQSCSLQHFCIHPVVAPY
jgi:hypothetical protein